jgi:hypothetical protein
MENTDATVFSIDVWLAKRKTSLRRLPVEN